MRLFAFAAVAALMIGGCASSLKVADRDGKPVAGVPFRVAEIYTARGMNTRHTKEGDQCDATPFERQVSLATGELYFANVSPAMLAKTEFGMEFTDGGSLSSISMNTEPAAADTVTAVSDALATLLPFAGVTAATGDSPAAAGPGGAPGAAGAPQTRPACDTGPENVVYSRFRVG